MTVIFPAEPFVHPGSEFHVIDDPSLVALRDSREDLGDMDAIHEIDDILKSRARTALRAHLRWLDTSGYRCLSATWEKYYPTLHSGHFSNMVAEIEDEFVYRGQKATGARLFVSRMTVADGAPCNNSLEIELLINGCWVSIFPKEDA